MKAFIYKVTCKKGCTYIGCTSQNLSSRLAQLKYQAPRRKIALTECAKNHGLDWVVRLLETCKKSNMFQREKVWIAKTKNLVNKSNGGQGPNGMVVSEKRKNQLAVEMKQRWRNNRAKVLKQVNAHKTKEFQSMAGKLGAAAKWGKRGHHVGQ